MADWVAISGLATAGGTLVLAAATFGSVRSANRAARVSERSLQASLVPLLVPSRLEAPDEKVLFVDPHWLRVQGGRATIEITDEVIYLLMSLRNVGSGLAVLHGWRILLDRAIDAPDHADPSEFRMQSRDIYVPSGDNGFWQGALRDAEAPEFVFVRDAFHSRRALAIELMYGDQYGGQRTITRFLCAPPTEGDGWLLSAGRHWQLDRPAPR